MLGCVSRLTTFSSHVGSVNLRPGLFEKHSPQLTVFSLTESRLIVNRREIIVNNDWRLVTVDKECYQVNTRVIDFFCQESGVDTFWELCHSTHDGQVVTITELTLIDVVGADTTTENGNFRFEQFLSTFPLVLTGSSRMLSWNLDGVLGWTEIRVGPRLTSIDNRLDKLTSLTNLFRVLVFSLGQMFGSLFLSHVTGKIVFDILENILLNLFFFFSVVFFLGRFLVIVLGCDFVGLLGHDQLIIVIAFDFFKFEEIIGLILFNAVLAAHNGPGLVHFSPNIEAFTVSGLNFELKLTFVVNGT